MQIKELPLPSSSHFHVRRLKEGREANQANSFPQATCLMIHTQKGSKFYSIDKLHFQITKADFEWVKRKMVN